MTDARDLEPREEVDRLNRSAPVAVFFVGGDYPLEAHTLPVFTESYGRNFRQMLFVSIGVADEGWMDAGTLGDRTFSEKEEALRLLRKTRWSLDSCLVWAHHHGLKADCRVSVAANVADETRKVAVEIAGQYSRAQFFVSKLVDPRRTFLHRLFHGDQADAIRTRLEEKGLPVTVLPVVLPT